MFSAHGKTAGHFPVRKTSQAHALSREDGQSSGSEYFLMKQNKPDWIDRVISPHILSIPSYVAGKPIAELARDMGISDAVKLASNENPLGPSPLAMKAMEDNLRKSHIYPESSAPDLRAALARKTGMPLDGVIIGNGSDELMEMAAHVFIQPGDEAVMGENAFAMYHICAEAFGGVPVRVPLKNYRMDLTAMAKALTERTRLVFLAIPNSPTGTIVSKSEFDSFLADLPRARFLLLLDEAYGEYIQEPDCPRGLDYVGKEVPVLVLRTFSKIYGLAGLRIGYGLGEQWIVELLNRVRPPFNANLLGQIGALAALEDDEHLERSIETTRGGMKYLAAELSGLGLAVIPSQANFITFCMARNAKPLYEALLKEGIIVRHLASFGMENCIRVTIGRDWENKLFVHSLKKVLPYVK
ncbi:MAG TPA: histidinol-phosphate transaminase [Desulfomonilaceae bacterium]|nr:histidinol-phosphate transaminase [Desulfomonilaceae bacterium]